MNYQRKNLADMSNIGEAGPLPADLLGLDDDSLSDLSASVRGAADQLGYAGQGFFPMTRKLSALAFKQRMTGPERIAIRTAAATNPIIADFLDLLDTAGAGGLIELDHADTIAGLGYLVSESLLTSQRAAAIRA